jgi:diaminopropionate ammonia-lyase
MRMAGAIDTQVFGNHVTMKLIESRFWPVKAAYRDAERDILQMSSSDGPLGFLKYCPNHAATPLHVRSKLAAYLSITSVYLKDESKRLGLQSFKALGGCYAIACVALENAQKLLGSNIDASQLLDEKVRQAASSLTFACATDGNHGRSVAAGARLFGARATIFLPRNVATDKVNGISRYGAEIIHTGLDYDGAVAQAAREAARNGWTLISDTSADLTDRVPRLVMHGYTVMVKEILQQLAGAEPLTHIFLQGGVGGLAAAVTGCFSDLFGASRPTIVVVEPVGANCLQHSADSAQLRKLPQLKSTRMAMLECGEPSAIAWPIIDRHVDFFLDLPDSAIEPALQSLTGSDGGDPGLDIGDSGAAGLAGLLAIAENPHWRDRTGLSSKSSVLVFATESGNQADRAS